MNLQKTNLITSARENNWDYFYFDEISSTNDISKELSQKLDSKSIVIADNQTKGRGQYGRDWESPPRTNLLSTFCIKRPDITRIELVSFLAGISVCETLASLGLPVSCKWPNDILVNNSKIAGILIEKDEFWYYIGIGLNVLWPETKVMFENNFSRTSIIGESGKSIDRKTIAKSIAASLDFWMKKSQNEVLEKYRFFWKDKHKNIKVNFDNNWIPGKLVSVLNNGSVKVKLNNGMNIEIYSSAQINYEY